MAKTAKNKKSSFLSPLKQLYKKYANVDYVKKFVLTSECLLPVAILLLIAEFVINIVVVQHVKYTEIDWKAYMQEVEGFLNGTYDYGQLKGDTGPLVYPAGFLYIYSLFYYLTDKGTNVKLGQYIFIFIYLIFLSLVFRIYIRTKKVPAYVLAIMSLTSYRIHSIFVLRLFNDPIAMLLAFASFNLFIDEKWSLGSLFFSLAVSVKMNVLLFAPALLLAYLINLGVFGTAKQLFICGSIQGILGLPFLIENPINYIKGSFNLGRVFMYEWTVNWRFLPEDVFVNHYFHIGLLFGQIILLFLFYRIGSLYLRNFALWKAITKEDARLEKELELSGFFVLPMFISNMIGVAMSRSLHYQFYVWYYHTLPYLLWTTSLSTTLRLMLFGLIELAWNTYPSTWFSSGILHISHFVILAALYEAERKRAKIKLR